MAKPIVKWAGGKSRLLGELLGRVPQDVRTYVEPFAGGAALFFAVASDAKSGARKMKRALLVDKNAELVACYNAVKRDVESVIKNLRSYRYDRDLFYEARAKNGAMLPDAERAARFLFLNRTCFNGLWRVNSRGQFNVPFGRYENPRICDEEGLKAASRALAIADIRLGDFSCVTRRLGPRDFVYFDPPYVPLTKTARFTSYVAEGFGAHDQVRLANELSALRDRGVCAMLSNADTPQSRALYKEFAVHVVSAPRFINSNPAKRGAVGELIVTTWERPGLYEKLNGCSKELSAKPCTT